MALHYLNTNLQTNSHVQLHNGGSGAVGKAHKCGCFTLGKGLFLHGDNVGVSPQSQDFLNCLEQQTLPHQSWFCSGPPQATHDLTTKCIPENWKGKVPIPEVPFRGTPCTLGASGSKTLLRLWKPLPAPCPHIQVLCLATVFPSLLFNSFEILHPMCSFLSPSFF